MLQLSRDLAIKTKMLLAFLLVIVGLVVIGGIGLTSSSNIGALSLNIVNNTAKNTVHFFELKTLTEQHRMGMVAHVGEQDNDKMRELVKTAESTSQAIALFVSEKKELYQSGDNPELVEMLTEFEQKWSLYLETADEVYEQSRSFLKEDALETAMTVGLANYDSSATQLDQMLLFLKTKMENEANEASKIMQATRMKIIGFVTLFFVISVVISLIITHSITRPMQALVRGIVAIEKDSDLTRIIDLHRKDEIGKTAEAFNKMLATFRGIIAQVSSNSTQLIETSKEVVAVMEQNNCDIEKQLSETDQVAGAIEEMTLTSREVSSNIQSASEMAANALKEVSAGNLVVSASMATMDTLAADIQSTSVMIAKLQKQTQTVGTVLDVISGISEQTNLLALNAAIEAARAGETGRGFAVVADEVRTLAHRTKQSTAEIQEIIEALQSGASQAVTAMERSNQQSSNNVESTRQVSEVLDNINKSVSLMNQLNMQIATASEQQTTTSESISGNVQSISVLAAHTTEGTKKSLKAYHVMDDLTQQLYQLVLRFKV